MAIYSNSWKIISRGQGRNAVHAAAYRHGAVMEEEAGPGRFDYRHKDEVVHSELALPDDTPKWLRTLLDGRDNDGASAALWNFVEQSEARKDAQLAKDGMLALPIELSRDQNIALVRDFVKELTGKGIVVDWSYHHAEGNPHVHLMTTLRPLSEEGFGPKRMAVKDEAGKILYHEHWAGSKDDLRELRASWASYVNRHLAMSGHTVRVDHRSHADIESGLIPTRHAGPVRTHDDAVTGLSKDDAQSQGLNLERLLKHPEEITNLLTQKMAVFDEQDIERVIKTYVPSKQDRDAVWHALRTSELLVSLADPVVDPESDKLIKPEMFSTEDMIRTEARMAEHAVGLKQLETHETSGSDLTAAFARYDFLSVEQKIAVEAVTKSGGFAAVVGLAGAGKSTLLKAANDVWSASGYTVKGVALAGKAAEELGAASGIASRTLASLRWRVEHGTERLSSKDVIVLDEAGMVGSQEAAWLVAEVAKAGAKLVMVGDPDQLAPISAGGAFRAIMDRTGSVEVATIRRQKEAWQRNASVDLARGRIAQGLAAYEERGCVHAAPTYDAAVDGLAAKAVGDFAAGRATLALAYTNKDVGELNNRIRSALLEEGFLGESTRVETSRGVLDMAVNDRVVFLRNDRDLDVKNGSTGKVIGVQGAMLRVELDGGRKVEFDTRIYDDIAHGYAVTIHKSQGATIDHVHVLATPGMRRNQAYVAMTRHRESLSVHYTEDAMAKFEDGLVGALSRSETKASTLDYDGPIPKAAIREFAERRGFNPARLVRVLIEKASKLIEQITKPKLQSADEVALQALKHWSDASSVAKGFRNKLFSALNNVFEDPMSIALGMLSESLNDPTGRSSYLSVLEIQPERFGPLFLREERKWPFKKNTDTVSRSYVPHVIRSLGSMREQYALKYMAVRRAEDDARYAMSKPLPKRSEELQAFHASLRSQKGINRLDERSKEAALKAYDERPDLIRENDKWFRDMERHPIRWRESGECSLETRRALAKFRKPTIEGLKVAPMVTRECDTLQRERTQILSQGAGLSM